jgi:SAM-dependent methyltransferase
MSKVKFYEQQGVSMTCRSFDEYKHMFVLDEGLLERGPILDVSAGASSFVAEANKKGLSAVAIDPSYELTPNQIEEYGKKEIDSNTEKLSKLTDQFLWDYYGNLEVHRKNRDLSLELFLDDYRKDIEKKRYIVGALPELIFPDNTFSLILCSHFLFLYQEQFNYTFHHQAVQEMVRVCRSGGEIRIYPLVGFKRETHPQMNQLMDSLRENRLEVDLIPTDFRFVPGATHVLSIKK